MHTPSTRIGAWAGLATAAFFAPVALVITELPDLDSASAVAAFYGRHAGLMEAILCSVSLGFATFLVFLGALTERLVAHRAGGWGWVAFGAALMFMTALSVALGIDAAAALLRDKISAEVILSVHSTAFLLAAPAAGAGVAFFIAVGAASSGERGLPAWSGRVATIGAIVNTGALAGFFSLSGVWNSGNGLVGGLAGPVLMWIIWIVAVSLSWLR